MLKEHLKGYIENKCRTIEEEKENLELVEYLTEADYA
jgi:hypothetical protein